MGEQETLSQDQLNEALFIQLVLMFQGAALQQMGKLPNPVTQKMERDLQQAKMSIDMITMLEAKTKGNLSDQESTFLQHVLFELRMNYVDEVKKPEPKEEDKRPEEEAEQPMEEKPSEAQPAEGKPEEEQPPEDESQQEPPTEEKKQGE